MIAFDVSSVPSRDASWLLILREICLVGSEERKRYQCEGESSKELIDQEPLEGLQLGKEGRSRTGTGLG